MNFTREDVLRELELLPVWKLRAPSTAENMPQANEELKAEILSVAAEPNIYFCTISGDKRWAFIWNASLTLSTSQSSLFSNILVALKITNSTQMQVNNIEEIKASVIIVMGEAAVQQLLDTTDSIETLRGKKHLINATPTIVTYHPSDILQNLQLKPKTWQDLCLAKGVVST
jgi:uracil-DNA glycosylase